MGEFKREERYIVLKIKDLRDVPTVIREKMIDAIEEASVYMPERQYVCVESDWPEYEKVWEMLEKRVNNKS